MNDDPFKDKGSEIGIGVGFCCALLLLIIGMVGDASAVKEAQKDCTAKHGGKIETMAPNGGSRVCVDPEGRIWMVGR